MLPWSSCPVEIIGNTTQVVKECELSSETSYFWYREALDISEGVDDFVNIKWWMILALALAWIIVYLIIMKGIQSSGYVVYFTAGFPYVVLFIFLIRGVTLPGAWAGIKHMFWPKVSKCEEYCTVWKFLNFSDTLFYVKLICGVPEVLNIAILTVFKAWCRILMIFCNFLGLNWAKKKIKTLLETTKLVYFSLLESLKLISRKIWVAEKLLNCHIVYCKTVIKRSD